MTKKNFISKLYKTFLAFSIVLLLCLFAGASANAATVPSLTAKVTQTNILALTKAYSPATGAYLQYEADHGEDLTEYYYDGDTIIDGLDTTAHEFCHGYIHDKAGSFNRMVVPYGDGKEELITYTDVFSSKLMAAEIPSSLRTFRYDQYVGASASDYMSSVQFGPYGLLNEYTAYYNGFRTMMDMKPYLLEKNADSDYWSAMGVSGANARVAYAEFKFYQLRYMLYAKTNYPDIYKGILNNTAYCDAFVKITANFDRELKEYDQLIAELEKKGYRTSRSGESGFMFAPGSSYGFVIYMDEDYNALMTEMKKSKYTDMIETIRSHSSIGESETSIPTVNVSSLTNTTDGVQVKWTKVSGATRYAVYRRVDGSTSWTKLGTTTGTSYNDTKAKTGTLYQYRLKVQMNGEYGDAGSSKSIRRLERTSISSIKNTSSGVQITWKIPGYAGGYDIYRKTGSGSYSKIASVTDGKTSSYVDKTASGGKSYTYKIKVKSGSYSSEYSATKSITRVGKTSINDIEITTKSITLAWNKVSYAESYKIYRKTGTGSYKVIATVTKTSYKDSSATKGKSYTYYVVPVKGSSSGVSSGTVKITR